MSVRNGSNKITLTLIAFSTLQLKQLKERAKKQKNNLKKKKSVKINVERTIRVIKLKRGGKKCICNILGFELFGCNLAEVAKTLGKKFGSGAAAIMVEHKEINQEGV